MSEGWNPRFVCYAKSLGKGTQELYDDLKEKGSFYPFTQWIYAKLNEFKGISPSDFYRDMGGNLTTLLDPTRFDHWLKEGVGWCE